MTECHQTSNQTVLQHGQSVWEYTKDLLSGNFSGMKLPEWFITNHDFIVNNLYKLDIIKDYNIFHDCGKPFCLVIDEDGKRHFPDHEKISKEVISWFNLDPIIGDLIGYDMALHRDTADMIKSYKWDIRTAFTLIITAFAEIHSNASMFGGIESTSFKMKWKKLDQRGKMLMNAFSEKDEYHPYSYVIVRQDIENSHRAVQGTHAAIEHFENNKYDFHPSVIYVVVKDEKKLKSVLKQLIELDVNTSIFREPMEPYDGAMTAICTEPLLGEKRNFMKKFMLLK